MKIQNFKVDYRQTKTSAISSVAKGPKIPGKFPGTFKGGFVRLGNFGHTLF